MTNIVGFKGERVPNESIEPDTGLIKTLEAVLEEAKSGRLRCFMGSGVLVDGARYSCYATAKGVNVWTFIGAITMLKDELIRKLDLLDP